MGETAILECTNQWMLAYLMLILEYSVWLVANKAIRIRHYCTALDALIKKLAFVLRVMVKFCHYSQSCHHVSNSDILDHFKNNNTYIVWDTSHTFCERVKNTRSCLIECNVWTGNTKKTTLILIMTVATSWKHRMRL